MEQCIELLETGIYSEVQVKEERTVNDLVKELGLEGKVIGILVNGKKGDLNQRITKDDKVVILPNIAGG